jgi:predicted transcriptional regulator of viral defense system
MGGTLTRAAVVAAVDTTHTTVAEVARRVGHPRHGVQAHLSNALERGEVHRVEPGVYVRRPELGSGGDPVGVLCDTVAKSSTCLSCDGVALASHQARQVSPLRITMVLACPQCDASYAAFLTLERTGKYGS